MPAFSNFVLSKAYEVSDDASSVTKKRAVLVDSGSDNGGVVNGNTDPMLGVALYSVSAAEVDKGKLVTVQLAGIAIMDAGNNTPEQGGFASLDTDGKAVAGTAGNHIGIFVYVPDNVDTDMEVSVYLTGPAVA